MNLRQDSFPKFLRPWLERFHVDFRPHRQPSTYEVIFATVTAVIGSLILDAILVKIGETIYPKTVGYAHFQFTSYAKLTVIGVLGSCAGWPIITRITSQPKWLFLRIAFAVTIVLLLPDLVIWMLGQPGAAVFVLVWMHLAIAITTYFSLVILAPVRGRRTMN
jgi:hypothetical protein